MSAPHENAPRFRGDPGSHAVVLVGQGPTALSALESLAERFAVLAVVRSHTPDDLVAKRAAELGVPVSGGTAPAEVEALVGDLAPDCVVVSSYDRILPGRMVDARPFVNVHYAPLPAYRGRATVNWAVLNREPHAAISVHRLVAGLDAGEILYQELVPIGPDDTVAALYERLNAIQRARLGAAVAGLLAGHAGTPQDPRGASYACARVPADGELDWSAPTEAVYALIRSLGPPYPGAFTFLAGRRLVVHRACRVPEPPRWVGRVPGRVVGRSARDGHVDVLTGDGVLRLLEVSTVDGAPVPAAELVRSTRDTLGLRTVDLLDRIAVLEARLAALEGERR